MNRIVYLNGHFSDEKDAKISIFDRSFLFSDSVYEVTTVLDGKMIDFDNHMKRLDRSMSELKFPKMLNHDTIKKFHKDLIVKNELKEDFSDTLMSKNLFGSEFIDSKIIYNMVDNFYRGKGNNNEWGLWTLYSLQKWAKLVYDREN